MNLERLRADLTKDEDRRTKPYRDSVGKLTIGIGHNLDDCGLSDAIIGAIFAEDEANASRDLFTALPWAAKLNDVRQNVLLNMCFNMGIHKLLEFKLTLAYIQGAHYEMAAQEMLNSQWAKQVGDRAKRLSAEMRTGEFQNGA